MAVSILAQVILRAHFGQYLVAQEPRIAIAHRVVERAAHRVFQRAMPLIRVSLHEVISRRARRVGDISGIDEDTDHHRNLLLRDQVVDNIQRGIIAVAIDVTAAILKHHHRCGRFRIVLRRHIDPVLALHAVVDFAGVDDLVRQASGGHAGLQITQRTKRRQIEPPAELRAGDHVVELVQPADRLDVRGSVPELASGNCVIAGPAASSMISVGVEAASTAKKKSGPCPAQAVPSFRSLASKLASMLARSSGLCALASAINSGAPSFSAASPRTAKAQPKPIAKISCGPSYTAMLGRLFPVPWSLSITLES